MVVYWQVTCCLKKHLTLYSRANLTPPLCLCLSTMSLPRYGTSPKQNVSDGTHWDWLSDSVLLYTSHDLAGWKLRATVFKATDVPSDVRQRLLGSSNLDGPIRCACVYSYVFVDMC